MHLDEAIGSYLDYLRYELNASPRTVQEYGDDLRAYAEHCQGVIGEELSPSSADLDLVRSWLSGQMDAGLKASSVARRLSAVKGLYRYLLKRSVIDRNPISALRPPKREHPLPVYVPTANIEEILSVEVEAEDFNGIRDRLIIAILYECGLRRHELSTLKDAHVDIAERRLRVLGKGNKERIVPFGQSLAEMIVQWRNIRVQRLGYSDSFLLTLKGKPMTDAGIYRVVHRALSAVPNLSRRGAHALRHSFATDMLGAGAELMAIKELMGHSQVSTTVQYTHTSFKQLQQMYNAHPRAKKKE